MPTRILNFFPTHYWQVLLTYVLMHLSGFIFPPLIYSLFPISIFDTAVYWSLFSFFAALIITIFLLKPDMQMRASQNAAGLSRIILWSIIGIFMAFIAQYIAITIETKVLGIKPGSENTGDIVNITRQAPIFLIIPALIAPILEEFVFRKVLFGSLYKRMNFFLAALISAFIFGIIHGEPQHILIYGSIGFVFAFLYVHTNRILVPIIVHAGMNSMTIIMQLSIDPEELERMQRQLEEMMIFIGN